MKTLSVAISLIALTLSGCAYTGYRSYGGYSGEYGRHGSGYSVERYYDYPTQGYYQPREVMGYGRYYSPSYPTHDHDRDRDRHEHWRRDHHQQRRQPYVQPEINRWSAGDRRFQPDRERRLDSHSDREGSRPSFPLSRRREMLGEAERSNRDEWQSRGEASSNGHRFPGDDGDHDRHRHHRERP